MKHLGTALAVTALTAGVATAGGLDRSGQSMNVLFEAGNYAEFSMGSIRPNVRGTATPTYGGFASGNMARSYMQLGGAIKFKLNDQLDAALIFDQPFGADVNYPVLGVPPAVYYAAGTWAELNTNAVTGVLKYRLPSNLSFYGGLRYETMEARASIPFVAGYTVNGQSDGAFGYLVGVAYEKPEIALRVALTYNSRIRHSLQTTEFGAASVNTAINAPQSVNLEFQTGIAKGTLIFGSVRWVDWSAFVIDPAAYPPPSPLVSYSGDTMAYTLGIGRKFNENWAGAISVGYETRMGGYSSNLGPTDGKRSVTIGGSYTRDNMKISLGVSYVELGNTQTTLTGVTPSANFTGNSAVAVGLKVGYTF